MDQRLKNNFKLAAQMLGLLRATPALIQYRVGSIFMDKNRAFSLAAESVAKVPGLVGTYARYAFYKQTLAHCGKDVCFGFMSIISKRDTRIGDKAYIGRHVSIGLADIAHSVLLSDNVQILSGRHHHGSEADADIQSKPLKYNRVILGSSTWVGANCVIMNNVGRNSIVGAGSVVVKPVKPHDKVVGVPARSVKTVPKSKAAPNATSKPKPQPQPKSDTPKLKLRRAA
ncbi:acyltransferase [Planctomycetota bacterium]|nr:acyltransferase [Planctomycetota bacterium]